jgi:hypothetical protein
MKPTKLKKSKLFYYKIQTTARHQWLHAYNPSYSGGRAQRDRSSKPAGANNLQNPISKISSQKRAGGVAQGVGPEFKSQYCKKNFIFNPNN